MAESYNMALRSIRSGRDVEKHLETERERDGDEERERNKCCY